MLTKAQMYYLSYVLHIYVSLQIAKRISSQFKLSGWDLINLLLKVTNNSLSLNLHV